MPCNPSLTWHLRALVLFELVFLVLSGAGLFFFPTLVQPVWPWAIPPYNAAFVGAIYLASVPAVAALGLVGRWSPARVVLPMLLAFTSVGFVTTLLNLGRFDLGRVTTWVWLFLFSAPPLSAATHLWLYRRWPPAEARLTPAGWRRLLTWLGAVLFLYGLAQFAAPARLSGFWPWPVDDFHGRLYSGSFIAGALGAWLVARAGSRLEYRVQALNMLLYGGLALAGLLAVDRSAQRVNWAHPGTWLWITAFAALGSLGLALLLYARGAGTSTSPGPGENTAR